MIEVPSGTVTSKPSIGQRHLLLGLARRACRSRFRETETPWCLYSYSAASSDQAPAVKSSGKWVMRAHHRVGREAAQRAERAELHRVAEVGDQREVLLAARCRRRSCRCVSTPRVEPMRQGVHLPQLSMAQNSMAKRACFSMSAVSSNTVMPAWPIRPSLRGEGLVVERRVEQRAREIGAERAADLHRLDRPAGRRAAADLVDDLAERQAEGHLEQAAMLDVAGDLDRDRAARAAHAEIACRRPRPCP